MGGEGFLLPCVPWSPKTQHFETPCNPVTFCHLLDTGFQAFEVQLVLHQALPNIWIVLKDQGVSLCLPSSHALPHSASLQARVQATCPQVTVKKVSQQQRWYLENASSEHKSCWREKILLSARGFSVFFQMLVKAQKVGSGPHPPFWLPPG